MDGILFAAAGTTGFGKSVRFGWKADGFVGQERHSGSQDNLFHGGRGGHVAGLHRRIIMKNTMSVCTLNGTISWVQWNNIMGTRGKTQNEQHKREATQEGNNTRGEQHKRKNTREKTQEK